MMHHDVLSGERLKGGKGGRQCGGNGKGKKKKKKEKEKEKKKKRVPAVCYPQRRMITNLPSPRPKEMLSTVGSRQESVCTTVLTSRVRRHDNNT